MVTVNLMTTVGLLTPCPEKRDRQYFNRNFGKFRQVFTIFSMNRPEISGGWKIAKKSPTNTCTTVRNDDVIVTSLKNAVFARRKRIQNSFHLYCGLKIRGISIQLTTECGAYCKRRRVSDFDDLKHRIRTEWTNLDRRRHCSCCASVAPSSLGMR